MSKELSIRNHPIEAIVNSAADLLPGSIAVTGVYYINGELTCKSNFIQTSTLSFPDFNEASVLKLIHSKLNKIWISPSETGIDHPSSVKKIKQLSLEDELENNVLVLKYTSTYSDDQELILVHFNKDKNNFEIESKTKSLNTENKSLIGHLLYNSLKVRIDEHRSNYAALQQIISMNQSTQKQLGSSTHELEELKQKHTSLLRSLIESYTSEITQNTNYQIEFTDEAFEMLTTFNGAQSELKNVITKAAQIAINLSLGNKALVYPTYLQFEAYQKQEVIQHERPTTEQITFDRYAKTSALLDRYEKAARELYKIGLALTGKNVGQYCSPSISAPAVTDSIKKHKRKIITLLNQHPEKWSVIRNEFKPILNILPNSPQIGSLLIGA